MDKSELNVLIKDVKKQDEIAFQKLFDACKKEVFGFLYLYTKNSKDAKSLLKKTFVKIRETVQEERDGTDAFAWILKTAHITALDYLKIKNKRADDNKEVEEIDEDNKRKGALPSVYEIINKYFEDTDRQIVLLKLAYEYKNKEIADILNIPTASVPRKYNNVIKPLKNILLEAGYRLNNNIGNLILAENEEADIKFFSDMTKTPISKPTEIENEKETRENFFKSASFISAVCCLTVAFMLFLITCL